MSTQNGSSTNAYPSGWDLRKGRITKLHIVEVPINLVETLTGLSSGNVHEQYVHKELISVKTLQEGLDLLRYDAAGAKLLSDR
jgi:hypothetical protein